MLNKFFISFFIVFVFACGNSPNHELSTTPLNPSRNFIGSQETIYNIKYFVESKNPDTQVIDTLEYQNALGERIIKHNISLPWQIEFKAIKGDYLYLNVKAFDIIDNKYLRAWIYVNDDAFKLGRCNPDRPIIMCPEVIAEDILLNIFPPAPPPPLN